MQIKRKLALLGAKIAILEENLHPELWQQSRLWEVNAHAISEFVDVHGFPLQLAIREVNLGVGELHSHALPHSLVLAVFRGQNNSTEVNNQRFCILCLAPNHRDLGSLKVQAKREAGSGRYGGLKLLCRILSNLLCSG